MIIAHENIKYLHIQYWSIYLEKKHGLLLFLYTKKTPLLPLTQQYCTYVHATYVRTYIQYVRLKAQVVNCMRIHNVGIQVRTHSNNATGVQHRCQWQIRMPRLESQWRKHEQCTMTLQVHIYTINIQHFHLKDHITAIERWLHHKQHSQGLTPYQPTYIHTYIMLSILTW